MSRTNKQRLTLMTRAEKRAAITGGAVDERIPEATLLRRLENEPDCEFESGPIVEAAAGAAGRCRGFHVPGESGGIVPPRMEPAQVVEQARATVAVIDELRTRLANLHPDIDCWANDALYRSQSTFIHELARRIDPDLLRVRAAVNHAGRTLAAQGRRTGPKDAEWKTARTSIAEALRQHSTPRISIKQSTMLSEDLLALCGLRSRRKVRSTTFRSSKSPKPR